MNASTLKQDDWVDDSGDLLGKQVINSAARRSLPAAPCPPVEASKIDSVSPTPEERPPLSQEAIVSARAKGIQDLAPAGYLAITLSQLLQGADAEICRKYIGNFLEEAGAPKDPIERLMLESTALAHHCAGNWTVRAANSKHTADAVAFGNLAIKMYGEFRRLSLALKDYRAPSAGQQGAENKSTANDSKLAA
jgi:hypothetical protein